MIAICLRIALCGWAVALGAAAAICNAQSARPEPAVRHPWGRFDVGSWKLVRVVTNTLDPAGQVVSESTADSRTALVAVQDTGVTLHVETSVEVGGKKVAAPPEKVTQGYDGQAADQKVVRKDLGAQSLIVDGREIECQVESVEMPGTEANTMVKTWHSANVAPYVLRRESVTTSPTSGETLNHTLVEIVHLVTPQKVLGADKSTTELLVTYHHSAGCTVTRAWSSVDVPGAIVKHISVEFDTAGRPLRTSTLELLDYTAK